MIGIWLVPFGIALAFGLLFLLPLADALASVVRRVRYRCPVAGAEVSVELVRRTAFGLVQPVDVRSCSAFADPMHPECTKPCARVLGFPRRG